LNKNDDTISILDIRKGKTFQIQSKNQIYDFLFEKTMNYFIVTLSTGNLNFYCSKTFNSNPLLSLVAHFSQIESIALEPKNEIFATAGADALVCLWEMNELISYKVLRKAESPIRKISFSHDSRFLASITEESLVDLYDLELGEYIFSVNCKAVQSSISWNPKMHLLAYCGDEKNRNSTDEGSIHVLGL